MAYISSNNNRLYVALESTYVQAPAIAAQHRIPAVKLTAKHKLEKPQRKDKTGTRTFTGDPSGLRRTTSFGLQSYMTSWSDKTQPPAHGALFAAGMGGNRLDWPGGTVGAAASDSSRITFTSAHNLVPGQAVSSSGEIRFVQAVADAQTVVLNAPFSVAPVSGSALTSTSTYQPGNVLSSAAIFDYWDPVTSVQRILSGAAIDEIRLKVNGDFHEFEFSGQAGDLLDTSSFETGQGGLHSYPAEPALAAFDYSVVPGHLGQAWLGSVPNQFFTMTQAEVTVSNNLDLREREFGSLSPRAIVPGARTVEMNLGLYGQDDEATQALYQAARQRSPISVMLQLGEQQGQLLGVYIKSVMLEAPEFNDSEARLQWTFQNCRAQGNGNDEIYIAFA